MITERLLKIALLGSAWILWVLLFLSVVSISVIVERWLYFRKLRDDVGTLRPRVVKALLGRDVATAEKLLAASPSIEAKTVLTGLGFRDGGPEAVSEAIEGDLERRKHLLEKGSNLLGTLGNNAPFIGLFGTVLGVIEAFHALGDARDDGAMGSVMAAIAEALVATGVGLFVAIPAVVAYNVIQQKVAEIESSVISFRKLVVAALQVAAAPASAASARAVDRSLASADVDDAADSEPPPRLRANGAARGASPVVAASAGEG